MKNGKLPVAKKRNYISPSEAFGGSTLDLRPEVAAYLEKQGLGWKWVSMKKLKENGGRHPSAWEVFQCPPELKITQNPFGNAPDGTITVGDLVLGVKPLKGSGITVESHRKLLAQKVEAKSKEARGSGKFAIRDLDSDYGDE